MQRIKIKEEDIRMDSIIYSKSKWICRNSSRTDRKRSRYKYED